MIKFVKYLILGLLVSLTAGCKKKRFLKYDNIIEVITLDNCESCAVYIGINQTGRNDISVSDFSATASDYYLFLDGINGSGKTDLRISWADHTYLNPTKKLRFLLVNEAQGSGSQEIIMQSTKKLKPRGWYFWEDDQTFGEGVRFNEYDKKVPKDESGDSNNPLSGKWSQIGACSNNSGERNYFNFSSSDSGEIGQIDCNNQCAGSGTYTQFDYSISGSSVTITPQSVSDYCGITPTLASPFTVPFSISGNILTLDGQDFEK